MARDPSVAGSFYQVIAPLSDPVPYSFAIMTLVMSLLAPAIAAVYSYKLAAIERDKRYGPWTQVSEGSPFHDRRCLILSFHRLAGPHRDQECALHECFRASGIPHVPQLLVRLMPKSPPLSTSHAVSIRAVVMFMGTIYANMWVQSKSSGSSSLSLGGIIFGSGRTQASAQTTLPLGVLVALTVIPVLIGANATLVAYKFYSLGTRGGRDAEREGAFGVRVGAATSAPVATASSTAVSLLAATDAAQL